MDQVSSNLLKQQKINVKEQSSAETAGTIASNTQPQPLFTVSTETAGTIASASNTSSSSSSGGFCANA